MGLPLPASKGTPSPAEINCVTRAAGNFTTIRSSTSIAKIDLLILIALEPKPLPPVGTATPLTLAYSSQSDSNNADGFSLARMIYFSSFERRRSASFLPPVWQVGQYCREESANDTSAMVSPQTSHFSPVRPCTRRPDFFSPFRSLAANPSARLMAADSSHLIAANSVSSSD